ncbi:MAG: malate dehydrogenase (quinone) [Verrucomicrobiota bacterium]
MNAPIPSPGPDVVLVGAGIMSATLGVLLKELQPGLTLEIFESLPGVAEESSDAWNNAGTGHAALCELNYTPQKPDGSIDVTKALQINEAFKVSEQLWSYLVQRGAIKSPRAFIQRIPHLSFVHGAKNVDYLRRRHAALAGHHLFQGMQFSTDRGELAEWMPLVMEGREQSEPIAATRVALGTDVNFGALTRSLFAYLQSLGGVTLHLRHDVLNLHRAGDGGWLLYVHDKATGQKRTVQGKFVFLGAGGGALPLLQKSGIPEGRGFGGFPVSGQWLRCENPDLIARHNAKVYGKAPVGAPPMSVPHLDTRMIDGRKGLLFGPFAGFTTRYLKNGSLLDFPLAIQPNNFIPMTAAAFQNIPLTRYLIEQVLQSPRARLNALREYLPTARMDDWKLQVAGQRVQIVKKDAKKGGVLQFGTEVIFSADGSIAALLGASPGASTAVSIMLELIGDCFSGQMKSLPWQTKLKEMIPSHGDSLIRNVALDDRINAWTRDTLGLQEEVAALS